MFFRPVFQKFHPHHFGIQITCRICQNPCNFCLPDNTVISLLRHMDIQREKCNSHIIQCKYQKQHLCISFQIQPGHFLGLYSKTAYFCPILRNIFFYLFFSVPSSFVINFAHFLSLSISSSACFLSLCTPSLSHFMAAFSKCRNISCHIFIMSPYSFKTVSSACISLSFCRIAFL